MRFPHSKTPHDIDFDDAPKAAHTRGPWVIDDVDPLFIFAPDAYRTVARLVNNSMPREELIANTKLIAAAPELLRQLKWCVRLIEAQGIPHQEADPRSALNCARAAIAKAEGQS